MSRDLIRPALELVFSMLVIVALASLLSCTVSCVTTTTKKTFGPRLGTGLVDCRAPKCPSEDQVRAAEAVFARKYHAPDALDPVVIWHALGNDGQFTDDWGRRVTGSHNRKWIECGSWGAWVHERIHVALLAHGFVDDHPDGVWADPRDTAAETEIKAVLRAMFNAP